MAYGMFDSTLVFDDDSRHDTRQHLVLLTAGFDVGKRVLFQVSAGTLASGELDGARGRFRLQPGGVVAVQVHREWLGDLEENYNLVLSTTLTLGVSFADTVELDAKFPAAAQESTYVAVDIRLSANFGVTVADIWTPYLFGRLFGGPILWERDGVALHGTDLYHYQFGVGSALAFDNGVSLFIDGSFLGEKAVSAGLSVAL